MSGSLFGILEYRFIQSLDGSSALISLTDCLKSGGQVLLNISGIYWIYKRFGLMYPYGDFGPDRERGKKRLNSGDVSVVVY